MSTLISPENSWALWSVILCGVAVSIYMEQRFAWAAKLSGPVLAILLAMLLSNVEFTWQGVSLTVMPRSSSTYDIVTGFLVPLAIPLLLLRANVFTIIRTTGKTLLAFHVAAFGTVVGAIVAAIIFRGSVENLPELIGIMTGSYTGGSVNFAAVQQSFNAPEEQATALMVADNFVMAGAIILMLFLAGSRLMLSWFPHPHVIEQEKNDASESASSHWGRKPISLLDIATALAIATFITATAIYIAGSIEATLSTWVNNTYGQESLEIPLWVTIFKELAGNKYVWLTVFSTLVATILHPVVQRINGAEQIGSYFLYIYLFTIGLPAELVEMFRNVPVLFGICAVMAIVNIIVTLGIGKLLRLNLEDLLISINAALGGPPSAAAMAIAKGWDRLVLPALLIGIWGYVIGTVIGITVGESLKRIM